MGYGKIPAETINVLNPKSILTNLFAIKLHVTNEATKIALNTRNNLLDSSFFSMPIVPHLQLGVPLKD